LKNIRNGIEAWTRADPTGFAALAPGAVVLRVKLGTVTVGWAHWFTSFGGAIVDLWKPGIPCVWEHTKRLASLSACPIVVSFAATYSAATRVAAWSPIHAW
jgi:hypothetical protein